MKKKDDAYGKRRMRRAQAFTIDVLVAFVILLVGIAVLYYNYPLKEKTYYNTERLSEDIVSVLATTHLTDLCQNPGEKVDAGCSCPNYEKLQAIACNPYIHNKDADMLSFFTEVIGNGYAPGSAIEDVIYEMFVGKNVIDERRFGFSILYTTPQSDDPLEIYNTERHAAENP